jgi:hypothetical protein
MKQEFLFSTGEAARYLKGGTTVKRAFVLATACAVALVVAFPSAAAGPGNVTCTGTFTGTAKNLTVTPLADGGCGVAFATITNDVVIEPGGFLEIADTTIGHDLVASAPQQVVTNYAEIFNPDYQEVFGPTQVGHDVVISGSPPNAFAHGICDLTVGHDLRVSSTIVNFGFKVCGDTVGHDLVVSGNTAGFNPFFPSGIGVKNNRVGHDLIVSGNTTDDVINVSGNTVRHDATCSANTPPAIAADGPNLVGHDNSCG